MRLYAGISLQSRIAMNCLRNNNTQSLRIVLRLLNFWIRQCVSIKVYQVIVFVYSQVLCNVDMNLNWTVFLDG